MDGEVIAVERGGSVVGRRLDERRELHAVDWAAEIGRERKRPELADIPRATEAPGDCVRRRVDRELEIDPLRCRDRPEVVGGSGGDQRQALGRHDKLDRGGAFDAECEAMAPQRGGRGSVEAEIQIEKHRGGVPRQPVHGLRAAVGAGPCGDAHAAAAA